MKHTICRPNGVVIEQRDVAEPPDAATERNLRSLALDALEANRAFLALATPTATQTAAQIKALTHQTNALVRLVLGRLDGTD